MILILTIMFGFSIVVLVVGLYFVYRIAQSLERVEHHMREFNVTVETNDERKNGAS